MKTLMIALAFVVSQATFAKAGDDKKAAETVLEKLGYDKASVKVVSFLEHSGVSDTFTVRLGFKITPLDSCQENFVGCAMEKNYYTLLYARKYNAICADSAIPRAVEYTIETKLDSDDKAEFFLNNQRYILELKGGKMEVAQAIF